ncbi:MAG: XRE family transcriptional regulator [Spirochaetaceae bacterium]|nr:MAG: XRE family transcriptional regulator [Spirochaetaceae bacterium]
MKGKKRFRSVTELVADVTDDENTIDAVKRTVDETSLGTMLFRIRCQRGLTQAQVATEMNTTQSAVSKIEHSPDDRISVRQIVRYTQAIGMTLTLTFDRPRNAVDQVKALFAEICEKMDELREIAGDDETIRRGVESFHDEWLFNTVLRVIEGKNELRTAPALKPHRTLTVVASEDPSDEFVRRLIRRYVKENADAKLASEKN